MMRDFESPGRSFAVARHGMAATSHPAALDMLRRGGNAMDAAVAAAALQGVVEVGSTGIGGDCFVLFSRAGSPKLTRGSLRAARHTFLTDDAAPTIGSMQAQPLLADTLEMIGRHGPDAFYTGAVAEDMVACLQALGGLHTLADFAGAKGEYVTPITTEFRGRTVFECPPNGQGVTVLLILNILSRFAPDPDARGTPPASTRAAPSKICRASARSSIATPSISRSSTRTATRSA